MNHLVHARFNPFEAETFRFEVARGQTVAEIVAACGKDVPDWFWFSGEVQVNGVALVRSEWARHVPSENDVITLHAQIQGGGGKAGSTKNVVTTVAAVALIAGATLVSGGLLGPAAAGGVGLGLFGASFAAGGLGATITAAALGLGATALLATLTPPPLPGAKSNSGDNQRQTSTAGISANQVRPLDALPAVLGLMLYSPPLLAPPYTTFDNEILTLHAIVGLAGQYDQTTLDASLQVNGIAAAEFDQATTQVRYGTSSDAVLTICDDSVIEDSRNAVLSNFILQAKTSVNDFLIHQSDPDRDLPQWQLYKTSGDADEIRVRVNWVAGIVNSADGGVGVVPLRIEIRERGTSTWLKMPVVHFQDVRSGKGSMRKEIRLKFVSALPGGEYVNYETELDAFAVYSTTGSGQTFQYAAESYFANTVPSDQIPVMTNYTTSGVTISMSSDQASYRAWQAADSNTSTFGWQPTGALPAWIKVDFGLGNAKTIKAYLLSMGGPSAGADWVLEGSNDDATWATVATVSDFQNFANGSFTPIWFQVDTPGSYRYYRLTFTAYDANSSAIILNDYRLGTTDAPGSNTTSIFASHCNLTANGCEIYLDTATFPKGEYEVRVKRGMAAGFSEFSATAYTLSGAANQANFFEYYLSGSDYKCRRGQSNWSSQVAVEQFATIENVYPFDQSIHTKGVCMIAIEAESVTIDSIAAEFLSVVPVYSAGRDWSDDSGSSNPAALRRHVLLGQENALALPGEILNEQQHIDFYAECVAEGREFNAIVDGMSVSQVIQQIDAAGYGLAVYSQATWGVIFEHDRSASTPVQVFTPVNTRGLTVAKDFAKLPHGFRVQFFDEDNDWQLISPEPIVYADGFDVSTATRIETLELPGFTNSTKAQARAQFDIRQLYLRNTKYSFEIGIEGLVAERGDLVGLNHDVISRYHSFARIKAVTTSGGNVTGLTLEALVDLGVAAGEVDTAMSAVLQLRDRTVLIKAVNETAETDTVTFVTPFALPVDGGGNPTLVADCAVGFGVTNTETKRCLIHTIEFVDLYTRRITLVDEAPELHA